MSALELALNIHLDYCNGCKFHSFPYTCQVPLKVGDIYPILEFKSKKDVMKVIEKIKDKHYQTGNSTDLAYSLSVQLPFFSCKNLFLKQEHQEDIEKYTYCKEFNISPYPGNYGDQPRRWIDKSFVIKNALAVREYQHQLKSQKQAQRGKNNG